MVRAILRRFYTRVRPSHPVTRHAVRLCLECLEDRRLLALFTWTGGTNALWSE